MVGRKKVQGGARGARFHRAVNPSTTGADQGNLLPVRPRYYPLWHVSIDVQWSENITRRRDMRFPLGMAARYTPAVGV